MQHLSAEEQVLVSQGIKLTRLFATALESQLSDRPDDRRVRITLAAHYSYRDDCPEHLVKYQENIGWLIENEPGSGLLSDSLIYLKLRKAPTATVEFGRLWTENLRKQPDNTSVLRHAAEFFIHFDPGTATSLLRRAKELKPNDPIWDVLLNNLQYRASRRPGHFPDEDLKVRIEKWRARAEDARSKGDFELAESAFLRLREFERELAELANPVGKCVPSASV